MTKTRTYCTLNALLVLGIVAYMSMSVHGAFQQICGEENIALIADLEEQNNAQESEESPNDTELEETVVWFDVFVPSSYLSILRTNPHNLNQRQLFLVDYLELHTPPPEHNA